MTRLTRQGVRDLDGPHNGRSRASCPHYRAPDIVPRHTIERIGENKHGVMKMRHFECCLLCGEVIAEKP